jgi:hypothetical protein
MFAYHVTTCGLIIHVLEMASYRSHRYPSKMDSFTFLFLESDLALRNKYLAPCGFGLVQKTTYLGSFHPMKAIKVMSHE